MTFGHLHFSGRLFLDEPIVLRQFRKYLPLIAALPLEEEIEVLRIGDTQKDELSMDGLELRQGHITIKDYCTKPEVEILVILREGLLDEYRKVASKIKPKQFVNTHLRNFSIQCYFEEHDMYKAILEYKRVKNHRKGELFLADLLCTN